MANTTYATTQDFRDRYGKQASNAAPDAIWQELLNTASTIVDGLTRGYIPGREAFSASVEATPRYFDDVMTEPGYVAIDDCLAVTTLTRSANVISSTNYKLWPYNAPQNAQPFTHLYLGAFATIPTDVFTGTGFYNYPMRGVGAGGYGIVGTWGYCTQGNRPPVIKECTLKIAKQLYDEMAYTGEHMMQAVNNPSNWADKAVKRLLADARLIKEAGKGKGGNGGKLFA
jgi:hypothetical protein